MINKNENEASNSFFLETDSKWALSREGGVNVIDM